jgi:hypothetical protein
MLANGLGLLSRDDELEPAARCPFGYVLSRVPSSVSPTTRHRLFPC